MQSINRTWYPMPLLSRGVKVGVVVGMMPYGIPTEQPVMSVCLSVSGDVWMYRGTDIWTVIWMDRRDGLPCGDSIGHRPLIGLQAKNSHLGCFRGP